MPRPSGAASVPWWSGAAVSGYASAMTAGSARVELEEALVEGLVATGLHVERIGLGRPACSISPCVTAASGRRHDHRLAQPAGLQRLQDDAGQGSGLRPRHPGTRARSPPRAPTRSASGTSEKIDIQDDYVERLLKDYDGGKELTVAWDAGNGAAGEILKRLTAKLPGKHILLYEDIDGNFPNHHPDPTMPENLVDLQKARRRKQVRYRHRLRRRRRPDRRRGCRRADRLGRSARRDLCVAKC